MFSKNIPASVPKPVVEQFAAMGIKVVQHVIGQGGYGAVWLAIEKPVQEGAEGISLAVKGPVSEREVSLAFVAAEDGIGPPTYGEPVRHGKDKHGRDTYYYASLKLNSTLEEWDRDAAGNLSDEKDCQMLLELAATSIENGYVHGDLWTHCKNIMKTKHHALLIDFMATRKLPVDDYSVALGQAEWATLFAKCGVPASYLVTLFQDINEWRWTNLAANMPALTPLEVPAARRAVVFSRPSAQPAAQPTSRPALPPPRQVPRPSDDDDNDAPEVVHSDDDVEIVRIVPAPETKHRRIH